MTDHASKLKGLMWVIGACLLGACFALGLSPLAHAIPWSWEKKLGHALDAANPDRECHGSPQAARLLDRLVDRMYPIQEEDKAFSIEVRIAKDPAVNAYATLGGQIFINAGLLEQAQSPEEVAGVLAHEIGHVHHRHIMQGALAHLFTAEGINIIFGSPSSLAQGAHYFMTMDFSRAQEAEADEDGLQRLQIAHVDNNGFKHFFERMEREGSSPAFLSDHPSGRSRIERVERFSNASPSPLMTQEEWLILQVYCR